MSRISFLGQMPSVLRFRPAMTDCPFSTRRGISSWLVGRTSCGEATVTGSAARSRSEMEVCASSVSVGCISAGAPLPRIIQSSWSALRCPLSLLWACTERDPWPCSMALGDSCLLEGPVPNLDESSGIPPLQRVVQSRRACHLRHLVQRSRMRSATFSVHHLT